MKSFILPILLATVEAHAVLENRAPARPFCSQVLNHVTQKACHTHAASYCRGYLGMVPSTVTSVMSTETSTVVQQADTPQTSSCVLTQRSQRSIEPADPEQPGDPRKHYYGNDH